MITKNDGAANFNVSATGSLVYVSGAAGGGGTDTLVLVDRQGNEEALGLPPNAYVWPRLSPEGTRLAVGTRGGEQEDVWTSEISRQASLKSRALDARDEDNRRLQAKIGELLMENELLYAKVDQLEAGGPLARRRSTR